MCNVTSLLLGPISIFGPMFLRGRGDLCLGISVHGGGRSLSRGVSGGFSVRETPGQRPPVW